MFRFHQLTALIVVAVALCVVVANGELTQEYAEVDADFERLLHDYDSMPSPEDSKSAKGSKGGSKGSKGDGSKGSKGDGSKGSKSDGKGKGKGGSGSKGSKGDGKGKGKGGGKGKGKGGSESKGTKKDYSDDDEHEVSFHDPSSHFR